MNDEDHRPERATIEYLDKEPAVNSRGRLRIEMILGVALLVALVGWAGGNWLQSQAKFSNYQAGLGAAQAHDWSQAQAKFLAAGDYADASERAAEAAKNVAQRDQQYALALDAAAKQDWIGELAAAQVVQTIQPNYGDSAALIAKAEPEVYRGTLQGAIVRRTQATPPGLYYRAQDSWVYLQNSDESSQLRANQQSNGVVLYDVAQSKVQINSATGTDQSTSYLPDPSLRGRALMAVDTNAANLAFWPVRIDPTRYETIIWGAKGGWGLHNVDCLREININVFNVVVTCEQVVYQANNSATVQNVDLPNKSWYIYDTARDGSGLLLAQMRDNGITVNSSFYYAGPDGANPSLLYSHTGAVQQAELSADGRHALLATVEQNDANIQSKQIMLVDLTGAVEPRVIGLAVNQPQGNTTEAKATFLAGSRSGQILLMNDDLITTTISLLDTASAAPKQILFTYERQPDYGVWSLGDPAGDLLIVHAPATSAGSTEAFYMDANGQSTKFQIALGPSASLGVGWIKADSISFLIGPITYGLPTELGQLKLRVIKKADLLAQQSTETDTTLSDSTTTTPWLAFNPGSLGLSFLSANGLFARSYDGKTTVQLEKGVDTFDDPNLLEYLTRLS